MMSVVWKKGCKSCGGGKVLDSTVLLIAFRCARIKMVWTHARWWCCSCLTPPATFPPRPELRVPFWPIRTEDAWMNTNTTACVKPTAGAVRLMRFQFTPAAAGLQAPIAPRKIHASLLLWTDGRMEPRQVSTPQRVRDRKPGARRK